MQSRTDFDDLTDTLLEGHPQGLKVWVLCLYFRGLNLSNQQIAAELGLNKDDVQPMTRQLREGVGVKKKPVSLTDEVAWDEVYVVAGHKGQPEAGAAEGRPGRRRRLKGQRGGGTRATEKTPIFGMLQRGGQVVIERLDKGQQKSIQPLIEQTIHKGPLL